MATAKRTSVRRTRARVMARTNSLTKPLPRPHGNRLVFSPELIADARRRYETTPETLESISLDLGASRSTLRNIANSGNWVRHVPPPRGRSRAAEIAAQAEALETEALHDRHPEVRAASAASLEGSTPGAEMSAAAPFAAPGQVWDRRERIEAVRNAVDEEIAALNASRARSKGVPHGPEAAGRTSRTLAELTTTLERLHRLEIGASQHNGQDANADNFSDMPADPDAFRDELARRIRAFVASRTGTGDADGNSAAASVDASR